MCHFIPDLSCDMPHYVFLTSNLSVKWQLRNKWCVGILTAYWLFIDSVLTGRNSQFQEMHAFLVSWRSRQGSFVPLYILLMTNYSCSIQLPLSYHMGYIRFRWIWIVLGSEPALLNSSMLENTHGTSKNMDSLDPPRKFWYYSFGGGLIICILASSHMMLDETTCCELCSKLRQDF